MPKLKENRQGNYYQKMCWAFMAKPPGTVIHKDYWDGHTVEIFDSGGHRSLYFGSRHLQSQMCLLTPHDLVLSYTRYMLLTLLINSRPQKILVVGLGSGSFVRFFQHHFPDSDIDAVDYSRHVINIAKGYFQVPENKRVALFCEDGYRFLQENRQKKYDLVLIDAFDGKGMAPTVYSEPFLALCAENLTEKGLISCNLWSNNKKKLEEIKETLADHFQGNIYLPVPDRGNIVAVAMPNAVPWPSICLKGGELKTLKQKYGINFKKIVRIAKQNNLGFSKRLAALLR